VILDGSGSQDPEGDPLRYCWTQLAGTAVPLPACPAPPQLTFTAPEVKRSGETLSFRLVVNAGHQDCDPASADVIITDFNHAPDAVAAAPLEVREGSQIVLDGSGSYDPDRDPIAFQWDQTAGTIVELHPSNTVSQPMFTAPQVGREGETLTFVLTVRDDRGASDLAEVQVLVVNENHPPIANPGFPQTVDEGTLVQLNGNASSDPDSDYPLSYRWRQVQGPPVDLEWATTALPTFTAPQVSHTEPALSLELVFELIANDGLADSAPATVTITVLDVDAPPRCDLAQVSPTMLWPPDHGLGRVAIGGVNDPDNDQMTLTVTGVTQDEPIQGLGDGDTSPDAVLQGDKVLLRAERSGSGNGRVYRVSFTADDGHGGSCPGAVMVCVPHDRKPGTCVDDGQRYDSTLP
jgi:hypothetical protein